MKKYFINATDVCREWSSVIDNVITERPQFIRRARDEMILISLSHFESVLDAYKFTARKLVEDDGSVTLTLNEIDLIENGANESEAKYALAKSILEYAEDFYNDFPLYSMSPNRKGHIPYVMKALIINNPEAIAGFITICQEN